MLQAGENVLRIVVDGFDDFDRRPFRRCCPRPSRADARLASFVRVADIALPRLRDIHVNSHAASLARQTDISDEPLSATAAMFGVVRRGRGGSTGSKSGEQDQFAVPTPFQSDL